MFVSNMRAERDSIQNFGAHLGRHLEKIAHFQISDHICDILVTINLVGIFAIVQVIIITLLGSKTELSTGHCS